MQGGLGEELAVATTLARRAAAEVMRHYRAGFAVDYKDARQTDPVTAADRAANALIVAGLAAAFPTDGLLAEESPDGPERLGRTRLWCVDPIDGTRDFVARSGDFVVMIGLAVAGRARLGVLLHPPSDTLWCGVDDGAWLERAGRRTPLRVSPTAAPAAARAVVSRAHPSRAVLQLLESLGVERRLPVGSVGLKLARLAEGGAEIYLTGSTQMREWDACAPEAVLRGAGGQVTDCRGAALCYNTAEAVMARGILATNGALHPPCLDALAPLCARRGW